MPNPKGINQYSKGGGGGKSRIGKTAKTQLKEKYQGAIKGLNKEKNRLRLESMPGMNGDRASIGMAASRVSAAKSNASSLKAAYRRAK